MSQSDAEEMIFIADNHNNGYITAAEFVDLVTVVYEPGWVLLWNYRTNRPQRFVHDLVVDGEFGQLE